MGRAGELHSLGGGLRLQRLELIKQRKLLDQCLAKVGIVVNDQDFSSGHVIPVKDDRRQRGPLDFEVHARRLGDSSDLCQIITADRILHKIIPSVGRSRPSVKQGGKYARQVEIEGGVAHDASRSCEIAPLHARAACRGRVRRGGGHWTIRADGQQAGG